MDLLELSDLSEYTKEKDDRDLEYIDCNDINYNDFFKKYLHKNEPCIVRNTTDKWPCQKLWTENGKPNLVYLESNYGSSIAPVANCGEKYYNSQAKVEMSLSEYITYLKTYSNDATQSTPCLYLKDWHFMKEFPDENIYSIPEFFASDWLNEYLVRDENVLDDYRFVYIGPRGSWTPFHSDVFSSFSWSVNICGKKKWVFYRPGSEENLRDRFGKLTYSVDNPDLKDRSRFPQFQSAPQPYVVIQEVGDAVFVPSGWHHQVWNLEDTISLNHNWVNGCNILRMWKDITSKLSEVENEISDCKDMDDWEGHCQLLLKSVYGMDISDFSLFLFYIAHVRLEALKYDNFLRTRLSNYLFGRNHILYDIFSLQKVFQKMLACDIPCIDKNNDRIVSFIESINNYKEL